MSPPRENTNHISEYFPSAKGYTYMADCYLFFNFSFSSTLLLICLWKSVFLMAA